MWQELYRHEPDTKQERGWNLPHCLFVIIGVVKFYWNMCLCVNVLPVLASYSREENLKRVKENQNYFHLFWFEFCCCSFKVCTTTPRFFFFFLMYIVYFYFVFIGVLPACVTVSEPWNRSYRQVWAATWVLRIEPRPSRRTANILNCWVISPTLRPKVFTE